MFNVEKYHKYLIDETSICEVCSFKPRFIDCFPLAYHNSFSVCLKGSYHVINTILIAAKYHRDRGNGFLYIQAMKMVYYWHCISFVTLKRVWDWFLWSQ